MAFAEQLFVEIHEIDEHIKSLDRPTFLSIVERFEKASGPAFQLSRMVELAASHVAFSC